jgi:hypothetical protein
MGWTTVISNRVTNVRGVEREQANPIFEFRGADDRGGYYLGISMTRGGLGYYSAPGEERQKRLAQDDLKTSGNERAWQIRRSRNEDADDSCSSYEENGSPRPEPVTPHVSTTHNFN